MRQHYSLAMHPPGFHRIAYTERGDPMNKETIICAHGLTLNGRYFDWFAKAAADHYRVICPDTIGEQIDVILDFLAHEKSMLPAFSMPDMRKSS